MSILSLISYILSRIATLRRAVRAAYKLAATEALEDEKRRR